MVPLATLGVLLGLSLLGASAGFIRPLFFISVGYGLAILFQGLAAPLLFPAAWGAPARLAHCLGAVLYGARLATFILRREASMSYAERKKEAEKKFGSGMALLTSVGMWISVSLLYALMFLPVACSLDRPPKYPAVLYGGLVIMYFGFLLEMLADEQKMAWKATHAATEPLVSGLYSTCRHPNYVGEVWFWFGLWLSGASAFVSIYEWGASLLGLYAIINIMISSARRLTNRQNKKYAGTPGWAAYENNTPSLLLPFPVYIRSEDNGAQSDSGSGKGEKGG